MRLRGIASTAAVLAASITVASPAGAQPVPTPSPPPAMPGMMCTDDQAGCFGGWGPGGPPKPPVPPAVHGVPCTANQLGCVGGFGM